MELPDLPAVTTVVVCIILIALAIYIDKHPKKQKYNNSISAPPQIPATTPTIVVDGVVIGEASYYNVEEPMQKISVVSVEGSVVEFNVYDGTEQYMPVAEFLEKYSKTEPVKVSEMK